MLYAYIKSSRTLFLGITMTPELEQKYLQLTDVQKEIFKGYGLRQVKHFVELSIPKVEHCLPEGTAVVGVNAEGRVQAINPETQQIYLWISDQQWQLSNKPSLHVDAKEDFLQIWTIFELEKQDLIHLSHIHRDFIQSQVS